MKVARAGRPQLAIILPDLLIGEYPAPEDVEWLRREHGVSAVLSLQDEADLDSKGLELTALEAAYQAQALRFDRVPIPDGDVDSLDARLDEALAVLRQLHSQGQRVYLHCNAGMNRAPTVAIAYLHTQRGMSLAAARDFVKARRACVPYMQILEVRFKAAPSDHKG